jgi:hypothetical protein
MSDLKGVDDQTAAVALTGLFNSLADRRETAEERAIQLGIQRTMVETLRSPPDNFGRDQAQSPPSSGGGGEPPRNGTGWVDARPIESPPGQRLIEKLVNQMAPPSPEWFLKSKNLTPEQMEEFKKMAEARGLAWIVELAEAAGKKE